MILLSSSAYARLVRERDDARQDATTAEERRRRIARHCRKLETELTTLKLESASELAALREAVLQRGMEIVKVPEVVKVAHIALRERK